MFDYDVFLSHAAADAAQADQVRSALMAAHFKVYCDRHDEKILDRAHVTRETAERLRRRMRTCNAMLYVMTPRAVDSKWMPWELGFFDGVRGKVLIYPVDQAALDAARGQEYLSLFTILKPGSLEDQLRPQLAFPSNSSAILAGLDLQALRKQELFGPGDNAATAEFGGRLARVYADPFNLAAVAKVNQEILAAWVRLCGLTP